MKDKVIPLTNDIVKLTEGVDVEEVCGFALERDGEIIATLGVWDGLVGMWKRPGAKVNPRLFLKVKPDFFAMLNSKGLRKVYAVADYRQKGARRLLEWIGFESCNRHWRGMKVYCLWLNSQ